MRETEEDRRLRHAACLLSDIGWRVHPDYRGEQTLNLITNGNFGAVSQSAGRSSPFRCFIAMPASAKKTNRRRDIREMVPLSMDERARVLGAAFRVAHLVSAARPGVLPATHFRS